MARTFEDKVAVRSSVPLLIGLNGPSSSGKTFSALRLAVGIQRVVGGDIFGIDTEADRMTHYVDKFKFRHVPFVAPFGPSDYYAAIEHCVSRGAKTVIVDSASHLHEGPGGVLEMHDKEWERMGRTANTSFPAWAKPKGELRRLINAFLQMKINLIFCFRAKEKIKPERGSKEMIHLGFMPIASEEFMYEMTVNILLYPLSGGVPTWQTKEIGERAIVKLPEQFRNVFPASSPLDEDQGQRMAEWAVGGAAPKATVDPTLVKNRDAWLATWGKKGIEPERVIAALGRLSVDDMTKADLKTMQEYFDALKAKSTTLAEVFPELSAGPPDDERGDEPTPAEMAS